MKYFDMNSSNYWGSLEDIFWSSKPPRCRDNLSFNNCVNLCTPKSCEHRRWLETNPFTRPRRSRGQLEAEMYFDFFNLPFRIDRGVDWGIEP